LPRIQARRQQQWQRYHAALQPLAAAGRVGQPTIPAYAAHNAHIFYLLCTNSVERQALIQHLAARDILAVFHYQTLHNSPFYAARHDGRPLPCATHYDECLVRLPLFFTLTEAEQQEVIEAVNSFFAVSR
jgi:dTDP-4-amino-4,6-dideoxygalactose transaminase